MKSTKVGKYLLCRPLFLRQIWHGKKPALNFKQTKRICVAWWYVYVKIYLIVLKRIFSQKQISANLACFWLAVHNESSRTMFFFSWRRQPLLQTWYWILCYEQWKTFFYTLISIKVGENNFVDVFYILRRWFLMPCVYLSVLFSSWNHNTFTIKAQCVWTRNLTNAHAHWKRVGMTGVWTWRFLSYVTREIAARTYNIDTWSLTGIIT